MNKLPARLNVKLGILVATVLAGSVLGFATSGTNDAVDEVREEFHHSYPLSADGRVSLRNVAGVVRIMAWDKNEVKVDAVKRAGRRERLAEAEIKVETTGDSVRIWTKYPDSRLDQDDQGRFDHSASVDYTLSVPRGARLDSVELVSGSLEISGITGDVRASTVSGRFKVTGLAGEAKLSTVSATLEAAFARTTEGRPITLNSVSGAIILTLPSDAQAQLRANSLTGPITDDFGIGTRDGTYVGHELYGQLGSGGALIKLNTVSGRITIQHANDGKPISRVTSLLSQRASEPTVARVRVRRPPTEALIRAERDVALARADVRRVASQVRIVTRTNTSRELTQAERNLSQARAELLRAQTSANAEGQRAATQALAEAERNLSLARAELQRNQALANADALRERSLALAGAQRKVALAQAEMQRVRSRELSQAQVETSREVLRAQIEAQRVQREVQTRILRETRDRNRAAEQSVIRSRARAASRSAIAETGSGLRLVESESKTLTVGEKPRVTLGTFDGRVVIHAWDKNEVMYTARKATVEENTLKGITFRTEQKGQEVSIIASLDEAYVHRLAGVKSVNAFASMDVYVPRGATVHASTGEGSMTIEGVTGEVDLRNGSGSITANNCKGRLTINAGSGRVQVSNFDGELDAHAGLGGIHLSGRFTRLSAQTNNEPIYLAISPDTNAYIEANAGSVMNEGSPATEEGGSSQRVRRFKVGRGGPLFTLRSGEGPIILRRADSGPM